MSEGSGESGRKKSRRTLLAHAGRHPFAHEGFVNTPVFRGSTVLFPTAEDFERHRQPYTYGTKGTPTTRALEEAWSELCGATTTVLAPSGLAAIALALMTATKAGDHLVIELAEPKRIGLVQIVQDGAWGFFYPRFTITTAEDASAPASDAEQALFRFVDKLTRHPADITQQDIAELRRDGWNDGAALEAVLAAALFAFINRISSGLGLITDF